MQIRFSIKNSLGCIDFHCIPFYHNIKLIHYSWLPPFDLSITFWTCTFASSSATPLLLFYIFIRFQAPFELEGWKKKYKDKRVLWFCSWSFRLCPLFENNRPKLRIEQWQSIPAIYYDSWLLHQFLQFIHSSQLFCTKYFSPLDIPPPLRPSSQCK